MATKPVRPVRPPARNATRGPISQPEPLQTPPLPCRQDIERRLPARRRELGLNSTNVLLFGAMGASKSSFVNTLMTAMDPQGRRRRRIAPVAGDVAGEGVTKAYER